jgi:hypothetical protein
LAGTWASLITGVCSLTAGGGAAWFTQWKLAERVREDRRDQHRIEQRRAVIDVLDKSTGWARAATRMFLKVQETGELADPEYTQRFNQAEPEFRKALVAARVIVRTPDVAREVNKLFDLYRSLPEKIVDVNESEGAERLLRLNAALEHVDVARQVIDQLERQAVGHYSLQVD